MCIRLCNRIVRNNLPLAIEEQGRADRRMYDGKYIRIF